MAFVVWHRSDGCFWFRVFGIGLTVIDREKQPPPFSVRKGYCKEFRIGKYAVKPLKKTPTNQPR